MLQALDIGMMTCSGVALKSGAQQSMKSTFMSPETSAIIPLKLLSEASSVTAGIQVASRRAARLDARSELPTMIVVWLRTTSLWTVLLTDGAPRVFEVVCCRVAVLLDLEGVLRTLSCCGHCSLFWT